MAIAILLVLGSHFLVPFEPGEVPPTETRGSELGRASFQSAGGLVLVDAVGPDGEPATFLVDTGSPTGAVVDVASAGRLGLGGDRLHRKDRGNVAYRLGRAIEWDEAAGAVLDCPEAAPLIRREEREGFEV